MGPESYLFHRAHASPYAVSSLTAVAVGGIRTWISSNGVSGSSPPCAKHLGESAYEEERFIWPYSFLGGLACGPLDFQLLAGEVHITEGGKEQLTSLASYEVRRRKKSGCLCILQGHTPNDPASIPCPHGSKRAPEIKPCLGASHLRTQGRGAFDLRCHLERRWEAPTSSAL